MRNSSSLVPSTLALAHLESINKAKAALNEASKTVPTSHEIWIAAARLLKQEGSLTEGDKAKAYLAADKTIEAATRELRCRQVLLTRSQWVLHGRRCWPMRC